MEVIGIDPGKKGAFVKLKSSGEFEWHPMPLVKGKSGAVDFYNVLNILDRWTTANVFIERPVSFGLSTKHSFIYGQDFRTLEIALDVLDKKVVEVLPALWTKEIHLGQDPNLKPKVKSLMAFTELVGDRGVERITPPRCRTPHDGAIDAYLIAHYGLKVLRDS